MKKTEYLCDRCRKPISYELLAENQMDFPYVLHRRIQVPPSSFYSNIVEGPSIDLCENCRDSFKKWLGEDYT